MAFTVFMLCYFIYSSIIIVSAFISSKQRFTVLYFALVLCTVPAGISNVSFAFHTTVSLSLKSIKGSPSKTIKSSSELE